MPGKIPNTLSEQLTHVKQAIRDAFSGLVVPVGPVFLDGPPDPFEGQPWEAVPRDTLNREPLMFKPEGYQYYLPAFLLASLDGGALENVMARLCTPSTNNSRWWEFFLNDNKRLTAEQSKAVLLFLEYIEANDLNYAEDARLAIDNYWSRAAAGNQITLSELVAKGVVVEDRVPPSTGSPPSVENSAPTTSPRDEPEPRIQGDSEPPEDFF